MTALSLLERVDPQVVVVGTVALLLLIAVTVLVALVRVNMRTDRRRASRVIALRSVTTYTSVPTPVDADWRDERGRPW